MGAYLWSEDEGQAGADCELTSDKVEQQKMVRAELFPEGVAQRIGAARHEQFDENWRTQDELLTVDVAAGVAQLVNQVNAKGKEAKFAFVLRADRRR